MAIEKALANATPNSNSSVAGIGSIKALLLAHPVSAVIVGGALIGAGTYYLTKKFLNKKDDSAAEAATA